MVGDEGGPEFFLDLLRERQRVDVVVGDEGEEDEDELPCLTGTDGKAIGG